MAKTEEGNKFVVVREYRRRGPGGQPITVHEHDRSNPCPPGSRAARRSAPRRVTLGDSPLGERPVG